METILSLMVFFVAAVALFWLGRMSKLLNVRRITDVLKKPSDFRSEAMVKHDAVMQLKNELAESGAIHEKLLPDGNIEVSIKVIV